MSEIEVRELAPSEYNEWDSLVERTQPGTLFHTSEWLEITGMFFQEMSEFMAVSEMMNSWEDAPFC